MASYLPWFGKKREHLTEREREFEAILSVATADSQLAEAAEVVRASQVSALKAKRAQLAPSEKNAAAMDNLGREIRFWLALSVAEVIEGYRSGKLRGHRATAVREATR